VIYPERFSGSSLVGAGLRTISLLLNGLSLSGVPYVAADIYLDGVKRIVAWCAAHGVRLKIRSRPGYAMVSLLHAYAGISATMLPDNPGESLEEHMRDCDLCLMYGMATTAAMSYLRHSIPILNPDVSAATLPFKAIAHPEVIVAEDLESALRRLQGFLADPLSLYAYRTAQFHAYLARFERARPLRVFLAARGSATSAPNAVNQQHADQGAQNLVVGGEISAEPRRVGTVAR
jgi:hypothetical protein